MAPREARVRIAGAEKPTTDARVLDCLAIAVCCSLLQVAPSLACHGAAPAPVPICSKSVSLAKVPPRVTVNQNANVTVTVDAVVNITATVGCGPPPFPIGVALVGGCDNARINGNGRGNGTATGLGSFTIPVVMNFPAGPAATCTISGVATLDCEDAATGAAVAITARGDSQMCIVDPPAHDPTIPRLDIDRLTPGIAEVHPGDPAVFKYRLMNNDLSASFSGSLSARLTNSSRTPGLGQRPANGGAPAPLSTTDGLGLGFAVYSASDPGVVDNFPMGFGDDPCLPVGDTSPHEAVSSTAGIQDIQLDPGESREVELAVRAWGMCKDGSCGEMIIELEGTFSDDPSETVTACTGAAYIASASVAASYECPDGGAIALFEAEADEKLVRVTGAPRKGERWTIALAAAAPEVALPTRTEFETVDEFEDLHGNSVVTRYTHRVTLADTEALGPGDSFQASARFDVVREEDGPGVGVGSIDFIEGAPTGLSEVSPIAGGVLEISNPDSGGDSKLELAYQLSGWAVDARDGLHPVTISSANIRPNEGGFQVDFAAAVSEAEGGQAYQVRELLLLQDLSGYVAPVVADLPGRTPSRLAPRGVYYAFVALVLLVLVWFRFRRGY